MVDGRIERRLREIGTRLKKLREELAVANDQLGHFAAEADETRLRSLVSETPLAEREHRQAQRHADAMAAHRTALTDEIARLERQADELLDSL